MWSMCLPQAEFQRHAIFSQIIKLLLHQQQQVTLIPHIIAKYVLSDQIITLNRIMKGPRAQTNEFFKNVAEILLNRTLSMFHGRGAESTASSAEEKLKREGRFITKALFLPRLEFFYL